MNDQQRQALIEAAQAARQYAYAPYSHYLVGAALLTPSGEIITGCNVENASYGGTICAERTAAAKAISIGERDFTAIAVVTVNGGAPCGICRQFLYEFAPELWVIIADEKGIVHAEMPLTDLLPRGFSPSSLP